MTKTFIPSLFLHLDAALDLVKLRIRDHRLVCLILFSRLVVLSHLALFFLLLRGRGLGLGWSTFSFWCCSLSSSGLLRGTRLLLNLGSSSRLLSAISLLGKRRNLLRLQDGIFGVAAFLAPRTIGFLSLLLLLDSLPAFLESFSGGRPNNWGNGFVVNLPESLAEL